MKILVVGCGSIGTRRAKILAKMGHEVFGSDTRWPLDGGRMAQEWCEQTGAVGANHPSITEILDDPFDIAFICTPPSSGGQEKDWERWALLADLIRNRMKGVFIEKPLSFRVEEAKSLAVMAKVNPEVVTMGACNLRFTPGIGDLRKVKGSPRYGRFTMGQHSKFWSAGHKPISMVLDSIHELDLAQSILGPIESISGRSDETTALVSVHHEGGNWSEICLDRASDPAVRIATIESPTDLISQRIKTDDGMYEREMRHFLECVEKGEPTCNPLEQAAETCRWALEVA